MGQDTAQRRSADTSRGQASAVSSRRGDLAAIHMAKKALGWDDDMYRDVMATVCNGVRSSGELDHTGRKRLLAHLQACLGQVSPAAAKPKRRGAWTPRHMRLWSLWQKLAEAGRVRDRSRSGLTAWVTAQTGPGGVSDPTFLTAAQLDMLIERAKGWLERA